METLQSGRNDPWYMLDNAEMCLKTLAEETPLLVPNIGISSSDAAKTIKLDPAETIALERTKRAHAATNPLIAVPEPEPVDPQFVELFIEEAKEEIASIQSSFPQWDQNPMDLESLAMIRRSFHTLKGSGRMVGARSIAEFGWAIENLLNRIMDKTLSRTPGMMALLRNSVAALPQLVEQLETGRDHPVPIEALMARAFAYADGREADQGTVTLTEDRPSSTAIAKGSATGIAPAAPGPAPAEIPADAEPAVAAAPPAMDPMLHDIYSKETSSHLAEIREYLRKRLDQPAPHDLPEPVYRAIHTLSGSSKMAEARHGIRITEPLNQVMRKVFDAGRGLSDAGLATLADAVGAIDNVVSHINESTAFFSEQPSLLARLHDIETELDAAIARDAIDTSATAMAPALAPLPEDAQAASEESAPVSEVGAASEESARVSEGYAAESEEFAAASEESAPVSEVSTASPQAAEEFDHEIANIYSEEATELLEAAEASLTAWNRDRKNKERVAELQRQLHTLKGGARMAGISAMGDLSHELETLVLQIDGGSVAGDDHAHAVMQASLDALGAMRDLVSNGTLPRSASALIGQIRHLSNPAGTPAAAEPTAAAPMAAAPPATPASVSPGPATPTPATAAPQPPPTETSPELEISIDALPSVSLRAMAPQEPAPTAVSEDSSASLELSSAPVLPGRESAPVERVEMARVDADLLDTMLNNAGEVSIFRARLDQQVNSIDFNLAELARTVTRLKEQLRGLEMETEAQVLNRHQDEEPRRSDFDPLELDRYSALQQFSRALAETSGDVASIQGLLETLTREAQNLLTQQSRVITELQNGLMRTRMVPFQRHVQRLTRLVRQAANDTGKRAELVVQGAAAELDRQMLERMVPPLEHMLRNAVVHGIEAPERRTALGKPDVGRISVSLERDGAEVVIVVADDGAGISVKLIREKAIALGLTDSNAKLTDEEAVQLILEPGFSTAGHVTQAAGRGVGMDVVATEVKKLGGGLFIDTTHGKGSRFTIRLPFTLAISQALIVRVAEETYALPLATVEGVVRLPRNIVARHLGKDAPLFEYGGQKYRFQQLGSFVGLGATRLPESEVSISVVLIRAGEHSTALVTDELVGSREIVVKSLGPQISGIRGIAGATILGDGRIVVILDMGSLVRSEWRARPAETVVLDQRDRRTFALVVDDSITVRRVTQRLLERNGMRVLTAKDGVDAVSLLQENLPDIILLDIEMPRMDGYEVAAHVRNDSRLKNIPIVMITSRVSEKHRARAIELGVDDYLGKPYQESQLLDAIEPLVNRRSAIAR
jgi:chemosensory pili system protein ChpA (sensor histidine kinase/response regulator)